MNAQLIALDERYPMSDLFTHLNQVEPIGGHFKKLLPDCMEPIEGPLLENTVYLVAGQVSSTYWWMPFGYARAFMIVQGKEAWERKELTIGFWKSGELVGAKDSFFGRKPSFYFIEFAAGSVLRSISFDGLQVMKQKTIETNELIAKILCEDYAQIVLRTEFLKKKAKDRYFGFLDHFDPKIEQVFELRAVASYLVMDPTTLSNLRG
ncbi:MAG: hypothetical protein V4594_10890 [Bacteroidota bacterium]